MEKLIRLSNAPDNQPLALDVEKGMLYLDKDSESEGADIDLNSPASVSSLKGTINHSRPTWLKQFFGQMGGYVSEASTQAGIDPETGALSLGGKITASDLKKVCAHLAWLYEAQYRQNKEILLWIGEIILDYMARSSVDLTIEEAIEALGLLERDNGVRWKLKTLARWPLVVQRIPAPIRQLPIPPTYLSEAALFSQPEDPEAKIRFSNARDALLLSVADKPDAWSRERLVNCMKELQEHFGVERTRNEGVAALQCRLLALYRIRHSAFSSPISVKGYYERLGLDEKHVSQWIYNIESELIYRGKMEAMPEDEIPSGDGLTKSAKKRIEDLRKKESQGGASQ